MESYAKSLCDRKNMNFKGTIVKRAECKSKPTASTTAKAMNQHLNKALKASHPENVTSIYVGFFLPFGITVFSAIVYGDSNEAINVTHEAPNGGKIKNVIMCNSTSKTMMKKWLRDRLDASDEVVYIVTKSTTSDGETVVKAVFAGDTRGYKLSSLDNAEIKSILGASNNIATTTRQEVA